MKIILNLPKLILVFLLLGLFFVLEAIVHVIYHMFEAPLYFMASKIEKVIRYLLKYIG